MDGASESDAAESVQGPGANTEELHPLQNPVILQGVMPYFNLEDLKSIRGTCQLWYQESLKQWRKLAVVVLENQEVMNPGHGRCSVYGMEFAKFINLIHSPGSEWINGGMPYTRYKLIDNVIVPPYQQLGQEYFPEYQKLFWGMCGSHITYLDLDSAGIRFDRVVDGLKWILLKACPNLTEIVLSSHDEDDFDESEKIEVVGGTGLPEYSTKLTSIKFGSFIEQLDLSEDEARAMFSLMPNLKSLNLDMSDLVPELLTALKTKLKNGNYIQLNEITLNAFNGQLGVHFEPLREYVQVAQPVIRSVTLRIFLNQIREPPFHFHRWLGSLGPTVEKLDMVVLTKAGTDGEGLNYLHFVDMTGFSFACLRSLKLYLIGEDANNPIQFDFRALKGMPNLWELRIDFDPENSRIHEPVDILKKGRWNWEENRYDEEAAAEGDDPTKMRLERLEILRFSGYLTKESFMLFGEWMPNLGSLNTIFNMETYRMSFTMWPNLRKVTVIPGSNVCCSILDPELWGDKNVEVTYYWRGHKICYSA